MMSHDDMTDIEADEGFAPFPASGLAGLPVPERKWIIEGFLPAKSFGVLFSPRGDARDYLVMDMLMASVEQACFQPILARDPDVARYRPTWRGRSVEAARIVYATSAHHPEDLQEQAMLRALEHGLELKDVSIRFVQTVPDLLKGEGPEFARSIERDGGADLIVIDDVEAALGNGDEDNVEHIGRLVAAARELRRKTQATVLLLHSDQLAKSQRRGWAPSMHLVETVLQVVPEGARGFHLLVARKLRYAPLPKPITFEAR